MNSRADELTSSQTYAPWTKSTFGLIRKCYS